MRKRSVIALFVVSQLCFAALVCGQGAYKAEAGGPVSGIPASVQAALQGQSVRFVSSQGTPVCEIWWRKGIPVKASAGSSGGEIVYGGLTEGELVGVIHFASAGKDYRGQDIKPGYYTLRYALIPQDGNHMGVSTYRDFLLLTPIANDTNPDQVLSFNDLVKDSRLATGTGHPCVLMLEPASQSATTFPAAAQDDQGNWALNVKLDTNAGGQNQQLPFAVVLVGQYQG
ncbi:MAG: hypothetical protein ACRD1N_04290 [Terriglobia bacterium]